MYTNKTKEAQVLSEGSTMSSCLEKGEKEWASYYETDYHFINTRSVFQKKTLEDFSISTFAHLE